MMGMVLDVAVCGPSGDEGEWHVRQTSRAGFTSSASFAVPCES
jgi:hypothetical protein